MTARLVRITAEYQPNTDAVQPELVRKGELPDPLPDLGRGLAKSGSHEPYRED